MFRGVGTAQHRFDDVVDAANERLWRAFVAVRGVAGADDALAEALAWAWEHRDRLLVMDNPIGYLYRVGLTRSTPRPVPVVLPAPAELSLPDVEPGLIPALLELSDNQRAAVWLVHACGWSYEDVAEALGIGRSTVGNHVARGLAALRKQLEVSPNV